MRQGEYLGCGSITGRGTLVRALAFRVSGWNRGRGERFVCRVLALEGSSFGGVETGVWALTTGTTVGFHKSRIGTMVTLRTPEPAGGRVNSRIVPL